MQKEILGIIAVILIASAGYWYVSNSSNRGETITETETVSTSTQTTETTTTETPVDTPSTTGGEKTFTMAEVAIHKDKTSCYSVIRGEVYDLTNWISAHPGGAARILSICGKDGTAAFEGKHGGSPRPEDTLAGFKIGVLAN